MHSISEQEPPAVANDRRQQLIADLTAWLQEADPEALLAAEPDTPPAADEPSLHTLLGEMAALRQEVRLQSRQEGKAGRELLAARSAVETTASYLQRIVQNQQQERQDDARRVSTWALALLDIRDAVWRGLESAQRQVARPPWWRRWTAPASTDALQEGYRMAVERCDRALAQHDISIIATVGEAFDAELMVAVEVTHSEALEDGMVSQEISSGCLHNNRVLRCAEVVVNRRPFGKHISLQPINKESGHHDD